MKIKDTDYEIEKIEEDFYCLNLKGTPISHGNKEGLVRLLKILIMADRQN